MLRSVFHVMLGLTAIGAVLRGQETDVLRASQLMRMEVRSANNDVVGEVKDVVLDRQTGGVSYVIVSYNRIPSKSGKLFAVPWQAVVPAADRKALVLPVSNDALVNVPGFDPNSWPDMSDLRWVATVGAAYGVRVRPQITQLDDEPRVIGTRETVVRAPRASRVAVVTAGTVKAMYPGDLAEVVIATDYGDVDALLAPVSYLDEQRLTFEPNANVRVKGYTTVFGDRLLFVATEVMTHPGRWVRLRYDDLTPVWRGAGIEPGEVRYLSGTVIYAFNGFATVLTESEGTRVVEIAPSNYFESRHWRLRPGRGITVAGYDDAVSRNFVAITVDHENERWRPRRDDGTPFWR